MNQRSLVWDREGERANVTQRLAARSISDQGESSTPGFRFDECHHVDALESLRLFQYEPLQR